MILNIGENEASSSPLTRCLNSAGIGAGSQPLCSGQGEPDSEIQPAVSTGTTTGMFSLHCYHVSLVIWLLPPHLYPHYSEQGAASAHISNSIATTSERTKHVLQFLRRIKEKMSSCSNEQQISAFQQQFYSHIKRWLSRRVKTILESELTAVEELMSEFESVIEDWEKSGLSDEDEIFLYTGLCEDIIENCKKQLPF